METNKVDRNRVECENFVVDEDDDHVNGDHAGVWNCRSILEYGIPLRLCRKIGFRSSRRYKNCVSYKSRDCADS